MKPALVIFIVAFFHISLGQSAETNVVFDSQLGWAAFQVRVSIPPPTQATKDYSKENLLGGFENVRFYSYILDKAEPTLFSFSKLKLEIKNIAHAKMSNGNVLYTADIYYRFEVLAKIDSSSFNKPKKGTKVEVPGLESTKIQNTNIYVTLTENFLLRGVNWIVAHNAEQGAAANP